MLEGSITSAPGWQLTILLIFLPLLAGIGTEYVLFNFLATRISDDRTYLHIIVSNIRIPLLTTISLIGATVLLAIPDISSQLYFSRVQIETFIGKPSLSIIIVVWAFYINRTINQIVRELSSEEGAFDAAPLLSNIVSIGIIVGTIGFLLRLWNYDISPLLGAAGVVGIALGIAARETVANFLGGIALYVDDTYRVGDFLELQNGKSGSVTHIGIRSTTLRTKNNVKGNVPNSTLNNSQVTNQSEPNEEIRIKIPVSVAYGTDIDRLETILLNIAEENKLVLGNPTPSTIFKSFGDSGINYELRVWIRTPLQIPSVKDQLNSTIYKRLNEAGIEIPYPRTDVMVKSETDETPPPDS